MYKNNRVKEFRAKSKLTQREVAKLLNMTQANYCDIENGKVIPNANQILKLCELYKCTPNDILGVKGVYEVATKDWDKEEN
ncbi:MAG: helix-turn-helix transcriptional regulator [Acholeplasma sp.]|nr:helix-turn-helix transcriptional regulator [Acholeplasma sp.]